MVWHTHFLAKLERLCRGRNWSLVIFESWKVSKGQMDTSCSVSTRRPHKASCADMDCRGWPLRGWSVPYRHTPVLVERDSLRAWLYWRQPDSQKSDWEDSLLETPQKLLGMKRRVTGISDAWICSRWQWQQQKFFFFSSLMWFNKISPIRPSCLISNLWRSSWHVN